MLTERQEQIEIEIGILRDAENQLRTEVTLPNYGRLDSIYRIMACNLIAKLLVKLAIEWDQIEADKCKR